MPYVLPGEEVRAAEKSKKKKVIWAKLLEVTSPSKERTAAPCPHFQTCGGCHYQHIAVGEQVRLKKEILRETLSRLGGISWDGAIQEHTAEPYGYRNRAQWAVKSGMPRALGIFFAGEFVHCADRRVSRAFAAAGADVWTIAGDGAVGRSTRRNSGDRSVCGLGGREDRVERGV